MQTNKRRARARGWRGVMVCASAVVGLACGGDLAATSGDSGTESDADDDPCLGSTRCPEAGEYPFEKLSEYDFFLRDDMAALAPKDGVWLYEPVAPLWSDGARKHRHIILPEGQAIGFTGGEDWSWPDGTILAKTFSFDHDRRDPEQGFRVIETRLLIRQGGAWESHVYLWNDEQTDAVRHKIGARVDIEYLDEGGASHVQEYIVPNLDQCSNCHERDDELELLGPFTQQLNHEVERDGAPVNQLTWLADQGAFTGPLPDPAGLSALAAPDGDGELDARARAYLHANCGHCHRNDGGSADRSGISLVAWEEDPYEYGVCKPPAAAGAGAGGRSYDIQPGAPEESIVIYRMNSLEPDEKMPELPNLVTDTFGVALITEWIAAMPAQECGAGG